MCDITPKPYKCRNHATLNPTKQSSLCLPSSHVMVSGLMLGPVSCCKGWKQWGWARGTSPPRSHISRCMILNCLGLIGRVNELWWCFGVGQLPVVLNVCWNKASLRMVTPRTRARERTGVWKLSAYLQASWTARCARKLTSRAHDPCWKLGQLDVSYT